MDDKIIENNKLIAEFMEVPKCERHADCGSYKYGPSVYFAADEMAYPSNWLWLMPVVSKIAELASAFGEFTSDRGNSECVLSLRIDSKIEDVYNAVVWFIRWYNSKPAKTTDERRPALNFDNNPPII